MTDRPTPETDAVWDDKSKNILEHARRLERERDEAREATEKAKAYKRVMKDDNAKLRRELADERAIADRLASVMFGCTARDMNDAYDAWKEARK